MNLNKVIFLASLVVIVLIGGIGFTYYSSLPDDTPVPLSATGSDDTPESTKPVDTPVVNTPATTGTGATPTPTPTPTPTSTPTPTPTPKPSGITLATVALHASKSDCWTAINGSVYNLTSFVGKHPGGDAILKICGKDGTATFNAQHGGGKEQATALVALKVGALAQ